MDDTNRLRRSAPPSRRLRPWLLALVLMGLAAGNVLLVLKYRAAVRSNPLSQQQQVAAAVAQAVVAPHETPVVSTVADESKLTNPALAAVVKNGDKILIYSRARRLIVYRPSMRRVVTMLTINSRQTANAAN